MRSIVKYLAILLVFTAVMYADTEGFDNIATLPGSGWVMFNNSNPIGTTGWFQGNPGVFTSHSGAPDSYIAANFNNAAFGGTIENWLAAPIGTVSNGDVFSFWTRSTGSGYADSLWVFLNTSGGFGGALELIINPNLDPFGYPSDWTLYTITIAGLSGPTAGRLEFVYYLPDNLNYADYIGIDDYAHTPVPEPFTMTTVGIGLAGMALRRKLRKS
ncbi:MAG: PEP-CTERM sorting domain-containing protein [Acidobacteriia bacterium]|nr:PEP-CTERM sorting domain-containing protein [Terriglobia bacterium]